ncbi:glutamine amidotransferase-related protein [Methylobacterium sp. WCS2018Hpa-22]|uniref:glutamine amidotransferase-related protein n=1 Tax=Methylobacterium sp. WCS2018Hpa-22 TaxID=3073633 RepID=UPI00288AA5AD|nr:gamma-glutamyl-gamma-aminobutyrate hydrolase family protein [Methylobacterium sp. WCS2018Hpa-22]
MHNNSLTLRNCCRADAPVFRNGSKAAPAASTKRQIFTTTIHTDEVETLPGGATLLALNRSTVVQAAEIRHEGGTFWGVQYHPEIGLDEVTGALRRQADNLIESRLARSWREIEEKADLVEVLHREPGRRDLAWRLGLDDQVADEGNRQVEIANFIEALSIPVRNARR